MATIARHIRPSRPGLPRLHECASVLAMLATACLAAPASAQTSDLHGRVANTQTPTIQQSFVDAKVATLSGLHVVDALGNDAIANGSLSTPAGWFTLSPHACSGGGPGFGGNASAGANADVTLDYAIVSATLPPGTPVSVKVRWAVSSRVMAVGQDMAGINTGCSAIANGQVVIAPNFGPVVNKSGAYQASHNPYDGIQIGTSGTLNVQDDSGDGVYAVLVGQIIRVLMVGSVGANSGVLGEGTTDGDAQMAMVWGVTSLDPDASAVLASDPSEPAPAAANATPATAAAILPPRSTGLLPCFRIPTQPEDVSICASGNATFSATALGTGPFTYQWRKGGVPIDTGAYPSAATASLSLTNVSAGDAGSYDCVVTNLCGDIISNAATLTICTVSVEGEQAPRVTRLAAARPAPFRASTTLAFDLAGAGGARLEVFDLRGARVRTLASGWHEAGHSDVVWRGEDDAGHRMPAGVYLVRLQANGFIGTQRIVKLP